MMSQKRRTFVTGFGPFGPIRENPSSVLARESGRAHQILEVSFEAADDFVCNFSAEGYERLLLVGVAAGRRSVTPELYARNRIGRALDVRGCNRSGEIVTDGPLLLLSSLWEASSVALLFPEPKLEVSCDAGTYLCNYLHYRALTTFPYLRVGFLHIPMPDSIPLNEQVVILQRLLNAVESDEDPD